MEDGQTKSNQMELEQLLLYWEKDNKNKSLAIEIIDTCLRQGDINQTIRFVEALPPVLGSDIAIVFRKGVIAFGMKDHDSAKFIFSSTIAQNFEPVFSSYFLAAIGYQEGNYKDAVRLLKSVSAEWHILPEILLLASQCFIELGFLQEALDFANRYLLARPGSETAIAQISMLYSMLNQHEAALSVGEQIASNRMSAAICYVLAGSAYALSKLERAEQLIDLALQKEPGSPEHYASAVALKITLGNIDSAVALAQDAVKDSPDSLLAHLSNGMALLASENYQGAVIAFETAAGRSHSPEAHAGLVIASLLAKRRVEEFKRSIEIVRGATEKSALVLLAAAFTAHSENDTKYAADALGQMLQQGRQTLPQAIWADIASNLVNGASRNVAK